MLPYKLSVIGEGSVLKDGDWWQQESEKPVSIP